SFFGWQPSRTVAHPGTAAGAWPVLQTTLASTPARSLGACADGGEAPPFQGGWLTLLSYDLGRELERLPVLARNDLPFPLFYLAYFETVYAYRHADQTWLRCGPESGDEPTWLG